MKTGFLVMRYAVLPLLILQLSVSALAGVIQISRESDGRPGTIARDLKASVVFDSAGNKAPELNLAAWGETSHLRIRLGSDDGAAHKAPVTAIRNADLSWQWSDGAKSHQIFRTGDGDLEWEIIINDRPPSNVLTFSIETGGLEFFYQDSICEIPGCHRPDNIKNSYAVYRIGRTGNIIHINGIDTVYENYGNGKAFHIYRPRAWDAAGDTVWCRLDIDRERSSLSVDVPELFLDSAVYPVVIDPTFGYSSDPATRVTLNNSYAVIFNTHMASVGESITGYSAFCADLAGDDATGAVVAYAMNGGLPYTRIAVPAMLPSISGALGQWYQTGAVSHAMASGAEYCVAIGDYANGLCCYYDSGSGTGYSRSSTGLSNPWSSVGTGSQRFGVYATYVVDSGDEKSGQRRRSIAGGDK